MKRSELIAVCLVVSLVVLGVLAAAPVHGADKSKAQTLCPIMGGPIDKTAYVDYEGKRVYFCCTGCKSTFLKEPEKYVKKMESEGIVLETAPASKK
jgi:YHS domain-containing protein